MSMQNETRQFDVLAYINYSNLPFTGSGELIIKSIDASSFDEAEAVFNHTLWSESRELDLIIEHLDVDAIYDIRELELALSRAA